MRPLAVDLFCGLGGWAEGLLAEGWDVIGFDVERHVYGEHQYPAQLVIQDVLTLHGSQFRDAALIVASPPCQAYSYRAMPWKRAKALPPPDNTLFEACFRIQREACEAAGRRVPLIVENVRGAQPWVGRSRWNFGSYHLWGDVPALMPPSKPMKNAGGSWFRVSHNNVPHSRGDAIRHTPHMTNPDEHGVKIGGGISGRGGFPNDRLDGGGVKHHGSGTVWFDTGPASLPSASPRRKMASAMIAKIPLPLARHIGRTYRSSHAA